LLDITGRKSKNGSCAVLPRLSKESDMTTPIVHIPAAPRSSAARKIGRNVAIALGALVLACGGAQAQPHGGYHGGGGGWGGGPFWGLFGLGVGLTLAEASYYNPPNYVVVDRPAPVYYAAPPTVVYASTQPAVVAAPAPAVEPIFYPRNGQSAQQTEADRQACNSWAAAYPRAMSDASVFQRATLACMDGRGYTAR